MVKQSVKEVLAFIQENFQAGESFNSKKLKEVYAGVNLNVAYFMSALVKRGNIVQVKRGLWSLPGEVKEASAITPIYISRAERGILDAILKTDLKSGNGVSRFGLNKLIELLTEEQSGLLTDLLPKLKSVGVLSCAGTGTQGKILEIKEDLFLKYVTDSEAIKEISLTDLEIDQKIKRFLSEEDRKQKKSIEISEMIEIVEGKLLDVLAQIEILEKTKESFEKEMRELKYNLDKIQNNNDVEKQFVTLLSNMDPEKCREIFKKILIK